MFKKILWFLPLAVIITGCCGLVFGVAQQVMRQEANDPQIVLAEDGAQAMAHGAPASAIVRGEPVEISNSLGIFTQVFDVDGNLVAGNAQLNGETPHVPPGVFASTTAMGQDRFTWQPIRGVRTAVVIVRYVGPKSGYVLVGRSLREVEKRTDNLLRLTVAAWLGILATTFVCGTWLHRKRFA